MKMKLVIFLCLFLIAADSSAQENDITAALYDSYDQFKEPSLEKRRIKHKELQPLINRLKSDPKYTVKVVGKSIEGRDLSLISIGSGPTSVFLWSQMRGDEPTATQAIFDIINFLNGDTFIAEKKDILSNIT